MASFMGIDQYGTTYHGLGSTHLEAKEELCERLARESTEPVYRDKKDGTTVQVGYVIGGLWIGLYEVTPWEQ
jgi:hypothetical protein